MDFMVGLADLLVVMSYYVKKELDENPSIQDYVWKQIKQEMQSIIYSCNQPFRGGLQSGFYNVSVYDDYFLDNLCADYLFPDGSNPDKEIVKKLQDIYLDMMNDTMKISPITFPVTTACFCVDDDRNILDKEFLRYISEKNLMWAFINIYTGKSSTLSSCCFDGKQEVYIKTGWNNKFIDTFENVYRKYSNKTIKVFHEGTWQKGRPIRIKNKHKMYKIVTIGERVLYTTDNHIHCTYRGDVYTTELTTEDTLRVYHDGVVSFDRICEISEYNYDGEYVYCFEMEDQKTPYFTLENGVTTHNCRLRSDKDNKYLGYQNSFGSGSTSIGSFGVVTINMPQIAYLSKGNIEDFYSLLQERLEYVTRINHTKRYILQKRMAIHALPLYDYGFMDLQKQYGTCGVCGLYECMDVMNKNMLTEEGQKFCKEVMQFINDFNDKQDEKYKYSHNLEQTPISHWDIVA